MTQHEEQVLGGIVMCDYSETAPWQMSKYVKALAVLRGNYLMNCFAEYGLKRIPDGFSIIVQD